MSFGALLSNQIKNQTFAQNNSYLPLTNKTLKIRGWVEQSSNERGEERAHYCGEKKKQKTWSDLSTKLTLTNPVYKLFK